MLDIDEIERLLAAATPGEWEHNPTVVFSDNHELPCVIDAFHMVIAQVFDDGRTIAEAETNAALIVTLKRSAPAMIAELRELRAENARKTEALTRLRDCDWVISLPDRMDAVRDIARAALGEPQ